MVKCGKCGVEVTGAASFCPGCGSPVKVEQQQAPPPAYTPAPVKAPAAKGTSPLEGIFNMAFSKTAIILVVGLGILLAWIGLVIMTFAVGSANIALLLSSMGYAAMGLFLVGGGIWNSKIDKFVRLAMVLIGVYLVVTSLSVVGIIGGMMGRGFF